MKTAFTSQSFKNLVRIKNDTRYIQAKDFSEIDITRYVSFLMSTRKKKKRKTINLPKKK